MLSLFLFFEGRPKASRRVSVSGPGRGPQGAGDRRCEFGRRGRQSVSSDLQSVLSVMCFICSVVISHRAVICREEPDGGSLGEGSRSPHSGVPAAATRKCGTPATFVLLCHMAVSLRLTSETSSLPTPRAAPKSHASCKRQRERCPVVVKTPDTLHPD